jgi:hypothetical protein
MPIFAKNFVDKCSIAVYNIKTAVFGYSERGIICSIAYFLEANSQYTYDFINILGIQLNKEDNYIYTFLVEQSFSDFGDSDLIIIIENGKEKLLYLLNVK